jgi:hypothetical protein
MQDEHGGGIVPVKPTDPTDPDSMCTAELTSCLGEICKQYRDNLALCYQKCCLHFDACAEDTPICDYRNG